MRPRCLFLVTFRIPSVVIISQFCPDKVEATMYALFAGSVNLGSNLANYGGAFVMDYLGVKPSGALNESRQFDNLWVASLISSLAPCIPLLLLTILVPDARQVGGGCSCVYV